MESIIQILVPSFHHSCRPLVPAFIHFTEMRMGIPALQGTNLDFHSLIVWGNLHFPAAALFKNSVQQLPQHVRISNSWSWSWWHLHTFAI